MLYEMLNEWKRTKSISTATDICEYMAAMFEDADKLKDELNC